MEYVLLAAETSLTAWVNGRAPQSIFNGYMAILEKVDPTNKNLPILNRSKAVQEEKRKLSTTADRERLYKEIMGYHKLKQYNATVLNKIERLLETNPPPAMVAEMHKIQAEAHAAGLGKVKATVSEKDIKPKSKSKLAEAAKKVTSIWDRD